jgi:asparagine synthase (glutamine-hydrolysing)
MTRNIAGHKYHIIYNGEIYNASELKNELIHKGYDFLTTSDTEVLLLSFIHYGADFISNVNGIFAFSIYDEYHNVLYLYRDHFGVKPLYYSLLEDNTIVYGSELKAIFAYPDIQPVVDRSGLCEIFALGPSKTPGNGVYKGISEVKPGHYIKYDKYGLSDTTYFRLISHPHEDSYEETVEKTSFLVQDAITRQIVSDVPICTFLSGGIDSSIVSSICATHLQKRGQQLHTYSFDFTDNDKYFKSNSFQPEQDRPYVDIMCDYIHSSHTYLTCDKEMLADMLYDSVLSRDLPTMADVDSSLLYFCGLVAQENKVVLTGECADEVFGGYPWFYKSELLECDTFPWMRDLSPRQMLLKKEFVEYLNMEDYTAELYNKIISEINVLPEDNDVEVSRRRIGYLNIRMFMQTLLDRMDRTSMYNGLEARVPFADYRLVQYMFNVPWEYKYRDNTEKSLLRHAAAGIVPHDVLYRKKSPYPKTYNPYYESLLAKRLREVIEDCSSPINEFLDIKAVQQFLSSPKDYGKPWYGQLMAGPQMIAYLLQINYWLKEYKVAVEE